MAPIIRSRRFFDACLVVGFIAAIALPGMAMIARPPTDAETSVTGEHHRPLDALLDEAETTTGKLKVLDHWFKTRFAFHDLLVNAGALLKVRGLGFSTSENVMLGDDGWLFYTGEHNLDSLLRARPLSHRDLDEWKRVVDRWSEICRKSGARLVVVIPPDKSTVYSSLLPEWARPIRDESRIDQLGAMLSHRTDLDFIDVRPALTEALGAGVPLYYRTDSHWNTLGAYVAAREIARALATRFPGVEVPAPPPFATAETVQVRPGGDLARMLGLRNRLGDEEVHFRAPPLHARLTSASGAADPVWVPRAAGTRNLRVDGLVHSSLPRAAIPSAYVMRDSFGNALLPYLAEHFESGVYRWGNVLDETELAASHPKVVIVEIVERYLMRPPKDYLPTK